MAIDVTGITPAQIELIANGIFEVELIPTILDNDIFTGDFTLSGATSVNGFIDSKADLSQGSWHMPHDIEGSQPSLLDLFGRTVSPGWGTADSGEVWSNNGTAFSVGSGYATIDMTSVPAGFTSLLTNDYVDADVYVDIQCPQTPTGAGLNGGIVLSYADASNFSGCLAEFTTAGNINLFTFRLSGGSLVFQDTVTSVVTGFGTGTWYRMRLQSNGSRFRVKFWTGTEPDVFLREYFAPPLTPGTSVGLRSERLGGNTNVNPDMRFDQFSSRQVQVQKVNHVYDSKWLMQDTFSRTVTDEWQTADTGHRWRPTGGLLSDYDVLNGYGAITQSSPGVSRFALATPYTEVTDYDMYCDVQVSQTPTGAGALESEFSLRNDGVVRENFYGLMLQYATSGNINMFIRKKINNSFTTLNSASAVAVLNTATWYRIRFRVTGGWVQAKFWVSTNPEPDDWTISAYDEDIPGGDGFRGVGLHTWISAGITNVNAQIRFDNFAVGYRAHNLEDEVALDSPTEYSLWYRYKTYYRYITDTPGVLTLSATSLANGGNGTAFTGLEVLTGSSEDAMALDVVASNQNTCADLLARYNTCADVDSAFASIDDLKIRPVDVELNVLAYVPYYIRVSEYDDPTHTVFLDWALGAATSGLSMRVRVPEMDWTPNNLLVSIQGAEPGATIRFTFNPPVSTYQPSMITRPIVLAEITADNEGNIFVAMLPIPAVPTGHYRVKAFDVDDPDNVVEGAFAVLYDPLDYEDTPTPPVEGDLSGDRWRIYVGDEPFYEMPRSPQSMSNIVFPKNYTPDPVVAHSGQAQIWHGPKIAIPFSFSGFCLSKTEYEELKAIMLPTRIFVIRDHRNRKLVVAPKKFDATYRRNGNNFETWEYRADCMLLWSGPWEESS
jgi:hypothetical protein